MDRKKLDEIKNNIDELKKLFNEEIKKYSAYRFAQITGCNRSMISRYINQKANITIEKMVELLQNFYDSESVG